MTFAVVVFSAEGTSWDAMAGAWSSVSPLLVIIRGGSSLEKSSSDFSITEGVSEEVVENVEGGSLQMDEYDEISNLVDLHMDMLGGRWKWQDL
ncbi:hypothetical protein Tco_0951062 [Tanacetum coccineum]|uniref:Uncharacterized protein n=1 Tax=Tanacetum coccineum TaxID=301880 RepID=A0ABQ5DVG4_9ASTR